MTMDTVTTPAPTQPAPQQQSQGQMPEGQTQQGNGSQDTKPDQTQAPTQNEMYEVTVNGKVHRMSLNELKAHASKSHAAQMRFEEAAQLRKETERFREIAKKDMIAALQDPSLGLSKEQIRDEFEKWYTREFIEPETLTPEQRKIKEYEEKLRRYQQEEEDKISKQRQQEEQELTARQQEYLSNQIVQALEQSGLPKTKLIASRMAFYMRQNLIQGWEAPLEVIVQQVREERQSLMKGEVGGLEGKSLIDYLGEDVVHKIRKYDLEQLRSRRQNSNHSYSPDTGGGVSGEKIYSNEVSKRLREMRSGKR